MALALFRAARGINYLANAPVFSASFLPESAFLARIRRLRPGRGEVIRRNIVTFFVGDGTLSSGWGNC